MRRPPIVLIVTALLLTGAGFGLARRSGHDSPSATQVAAVSVPEADVVPEVSSTEELPATSEPALTIEPAARSVSAKSSPDPADPAEEESVIEPAPEVEGPPAHLDEKAASSAPEPAQVVTTTSTTPPTTTAPPPPAEPSVAFTASQAYGSCDEPVPYDIFSGTAEPGSTVTVSSPHGSGVVHADSAGHWQIQVEFPAAPRGATFAVTASGVGGSRTFDFTVGH